MITIEWAKTLQILYWQTRKSENWSIIKALHDSEDHNYFKTLDRTHFPARVKMGEKPPEAIFRIYDDLKIPIPK